MAQSRARLKEWREENKERIAQYFKEYLQRPEVKEKRRLKARAEWEESKRKRLENTFG